MLGTLAQAVSPAIPEFCDFCRRLLRAGRGLIANARGQNSRHDQENTAANNCEQPVVPEQGIHHPTKREGSDNLGQRDKEVEDSNVQPCLFTRQRPPQKRERQGQHARPRKADSRHGKQQQPQVMKNEDSNES